MRRLWFGSVPKQHKSPSLDSLKQLYALLLKNAVVDGNNRTLIVELLRSIAETVIWGDQNDSRVFDFFLEKGIQSYFLSIIEQPRCGTYVCTQLLQTLNILFENIRNETSIYFLLSNNHVNSIICHEFDFSDEEIMAYYISFLKTLSLKLNNNTIHFFYNEHLRDFPLYTEAIKFFNHSESMVRIAVRTLTLNVYKVGDEATLKFIHDKTSAPYFSNLVWFIGNNVLMMERCLRTEATHLTRNKLESLVALHLDDVHYVNDILQLQILSLNSMLCSHLLNTLFIPLYVYSLAPELEVDSPQVSVKCALFLLSQIFLILSHPPLVKQLKLYICFEENPRIAENEDPSGKMRKFAKPTEKIQDRLRPAVIPKNKQNLQPTKAGKEHKETLRQREERKEREDDRQRDQERYQKKNETFSKAGYLKSILEPDVSIDPLLGARVHRVDSVSRMDQSVTRSRESSSVSKESSLYSEAVYVDSEECHTESFTDILVEELPQPAPEYAHSEDSGIVTSESMEPLARPENDHLGEGRRGEETEKNDEVVEGSDNGDTTLDMREERRERSGAVCDELELRTQTTSSESQASVSEPLSAAESSVDVLNSESSHTLDYNSEDDRTTLRTGSALEDIPIKDIEDGEEGQSVPSLEEGQSVPSLEEGQSVPPLEEGQSVPSLEEGQSVPSLEEGQSVPSLEEGQSVPSLEEGQSVPPLEEGQSVPSLEEGQSVPSLEEGQSVPSLEEGQSVPSLEEGQSVPSLEEGQSVPSLEEGQSVPPLEEGQSVPSLEEGQSVPPLEEGQSVPTLADISTSSELQKTPTKDDDSEASSPRCLFTPTKNDSSFADAFHCPPARSCIFYDALLSCLELSEEDTEALFSTALILAMFTNKSMPYTSPGAYCYDERIVDRLLNILEKACHPESIVRLVSVELVVRLFKILSVWQGKVTLQDHHVAVITAIKENSVRHVRTFYTGEDDTLFIELFDEEYKALLKRKPTDVGHLMSDECMLLGPVYTPLTGIDFWKRLPCGDIEKMRRCLIVFFTIRQLWQSIIGEEEAELPLLNMSLQVSPGDILNLNNSDLIACAVHTNKEVVKRFLVIDTHQLILVEPDNAPDRLGWGIVRFVVALQNVESKPDKDNNKNLLINVEKLPRFSGKFQFEDHIRCFAAKTRLKQGRDNLQKLKGFKLTRVLDIRDRFVDEPCIISPRGPLSVYKPGTLPKKPPPIRTMSQVDAHIESEMVSRIVRTAPGSPAGLVPKSHSTTTSEVRTRSVPGSPAGSVPGTPSSTRKLRKLPDPEVV